MEKPYDYKTSEKAIQEFWEKENTYSIKNYSGPLFSIDTPPPTVSGTLHIGHIFSYTQTDIIARFKRMAGNSVYYPFGFDDNGLPTERYVEKKYSVNAHQMRRSEFIELCLKETTLVEKEFENLWKQIGLSVDWSSCYSTICKNTQIISQTSFIELYNKGFVYRKEEPALYCTTCQTTVAQAELEDLEKSTFFNDIIFKGCDFQDLIVSTTRPELLASTVALLYHPDDKRYKNLKIKTAIVPFYNIEIPILEDKDVDPEKGTGLVMVSTFGDKQDIIWAKRHNLPFKQSIGKDGKWTALTGPLEGLKVKDARKKIIELLKENNLLKTQKEILHNVNVHERCKHEIEYLVFPQWFLKILEYKNKFIELADNIRWHQEFMKSRYTHWVQNINWDWCLSRQRFYGIPFPVWYCAECNEIILAKIENLPVDPKETKYTGNCPSCKSSSIIPDNDVMDTWNTSSLTPYICKSLYEKTLEVFQNKKNSFFPMSMRPQAHDIIRTWAFYSIVKMWMHNENIPWDDIVISGHVLTKQKQKISKSQANDPYNPTILLKNYPSDAIRFWTASAGLGHDISFSESQIKIGQRLLLKLWNAFKFAKPHIEKLDIKKTPKNFGILNEWILDAISKSYETYKKHFENYEFNLALSQIEHFFWKDFCDNYLELIKHQLFNQEQYNLEEIHATKWTLYSLGIRILQFYSPFIPHITENLYSQIYKINEKTDSIHQTKFNNYQQHYKFDNSIFLMIKILEILNQVRKLKTEHQLSLKSPLENLTIITTKDLQKKLKEHENIVKGVTHAKNINYDLQEKETQLIKNNGVYKAIISIK